jgi:putative phage-type endonuclease
MSIHNINNVIDKEIYKFIKNNKSVSILTKHNDIIGKNKNIEKNLISNRLETISKNRIILDNLMKIPVIEQRTKEWYDARDTRLTASDLCDAIKKGAVSDKIAKKKAKILVDNTNYNNVPALKWGTMFEHMAARCYSQINNDIIIHDFGLICDNNNKHFGASPDGINELGIMIEIKCPISRKIIDGVIPEKYKMQIQGQLAVCNLTECDYVECDFNELFSEEEYMSKYSLAKINHGIIAQYQSNGEYIYLYSDPYLNSNECLNNINDKISKYANINAVFNKLVYWELNLINVQRETFNQEKWNKIEPMINEFWEKVENFRTMPIEDNIKKFKFIDDND